MLTHSIQVSCNGVFVFEGTGTGNVIGGIAFFYLGYPVTDRVKKQEPNIRSTYALSDAFETIEVIITRISYSAGELTNATD